MIAVVQQIARICDAEGLSMQGSFRAFIVTGQSVTKTLLRKEMDHEDRNCSDCLQKAVGRVRHALLMFR